MVRFKNRWFLVEFLYPSSQPVSPSPSIQLNSPDSDPTVSSIPTLTPHSGPPKRVPPSRQGDASRKKPKLATGTRRSKDDSDDDAADQVSDTEDESDVEYDSAVNLDDEANPGLLNQNLGPMPLFLPPAPNPTTGKIKRLDEKSIHQALKASVIQTFGDDGWGRVGANTSVKYYSPYTSLSIIRTSRDHHRTVWAALSLLGPVNGERVVARVVRCSGTIKKIQLAAIAYNRLIVSTVLDCARTETASKSSTSQAVAVSSGGTKGTSTASDRPQVVLAAPEGEGGWEGWRVKETDVIRSMTD